MNAYYISLSHCEPGFRQPPSCQVCFKKSAWRGLCHHLKWTFRISINGFWLTKSGILVQIFRESRDADEKPTDLHMFYQSHMIKKKCSNQNLRLSNSKGVLHECQFCHQKWCKTKGQIHPVLLIHGKAPTLLLCEEPPAVRVEGSTAEYQWYELCKKCLGNRWILLIGWCQRGILLKLSIMWFLLLWTNKHMFSVASAFTDMAANVGFIWKCQEIMEEGAAPDWHPNLILFWIRFPPIFSYLVRQWLPKFGMHACKPMEKTKTKWCGHTELLVNPCMCTKCFAIIYQIARHNPLPVKSSAASSATSSPAPWQMSYTQFS